MKSRKAGYRAKFELNKFLSNEILVAVGNKDLNISFTKQDVRFDRYFSKDGKEIVLSAGMGYTMVRLFNAHCRNGKPGQEIRGSGFCALIKVNIPFSYAVIATAGSPVIHHLLKAVVP